MFANVAAIRGGTKLERRRIRSSVMSTYYKNYYRPVLCKCPDELVYSRIQDITFPKELSQAEKIMVIVVPEDNAMSGGIYSFFSIADKMRQLKRFHQYEVVLMTRPNMMRVTYFRNTNFRNSENVYRFDQLVDCVALKEIFLHIPEYMSEHFLGDLSVDIESYLKRRKVYINILNQNIRLMPPKDCYSDLYILSKDVTQSVAHHAYFNQEVANRYGLPTLLLPAYTDLSNYPSMTFEEKEQLIIYSPDEAPYKQECLEKIRREFPDFRLIEIKGITFDCYMDLATRCMFSITFGEGFDGYLAQPIYQGGIGFSVYNDDFFPESFRGYENIFPNEGDMIDKICVCMRNLANSVNSYKKLNAELQSEYNKLYSFDDYMNQLKKLSMRDFEIYPRSSIFQ